MGILALSSCSHHRPSDALEEKTSSVAASKSTKSKDKLPTEWDLSSLYKACDAPEIQKDQEALQKGIASFCAHTKGKLTVSNLAAALDAYDDLIRKATKLGTYAFLYYQTRLHDAQASAFFQKFSEFETHAFSKLSFFPVETLTLNFEALQRHMKATPALAVYKAWIEDLFKNRKHVLSTPEEIILAKADLAGGAAWRKLYDEVLSHIDFSLNGKKCKLGAITHKMAHGKTNEIRKKAALSLEKGLKDHELILRSLYNNILLSWSVTNEIRGYKTPEEQRFVSESMDPETASAMIAATVEAYPTLSQRYYSIKAKILKQKKLQYWDRSIPVKLTDVFSKKITYPQAVEKVLSIYKTFSPTFFVLARDLVENGWVDVYPKDGKRGGAFSDSSSVDTHPFVMLNFMGSQRALLTLAHELGHSVHQSLARQNRQLVANPALALSETASTFAEKLVYDHLLVHTSKRREKIELMCAYLDDVMNTVVRQVAFFRFEQKAHRLRQERELTSQDLDKIWRETQAEALEPALEIHPCTDRFWAYIHHFFESPFYVYSYAFGRLFVEALYQEYVKNKAAFVPKYEKMLASGGTLRYDEAATLVGIDLKAKQFWKGVLKLLENQVDQLETWCREEGIL
ncbi:oligoendopeptidase F [Alphaproteobacteria bacterium]|nr:oligoendopeptidase F [Alphaproteobacteria bacterium]GHS98059.1 oligoendopeptidase F [Alphaproteobacteria bacterium]